MSTPEPLLKRKECFLYQNQITGHRDEAGRFKPETYIQGPGLLGYDNLLQEVPIKKAFFPFSSPSPDSKKLLSKSDGRTARACGNRLKKKIGGHKVPSSIREDYPNQGAGPVLSAEPLRLLLGMFCIFALSGLPPAEAPSTLPHAMDVPLRVACSNPMVQLFQVLPVWPSPLPWASSASKRPHSRSGSTAQDLG
ncbi:hypothetical protein U1Q18_024833 [Sarracenia purpurea var. burkii]